MSMFSSINKEYNKERNKLADDQIILESVVGTDVMPMSDEEDDEIVDADSIPEAQLNKAMKHIDELIDKEDFDDLEIEDLIDEDFDEELGVEETE